VGSPVMTRPEFGESRSIIAQNGCNVNRCVIYSPYRAIAFGYLGCEIARSPRLEGVPFGQIRQSHLATWVAKSLGALVSRAFHSAKSGYLALVRACRPRGRGLIAPNAFALTRPKMSLDRLLEYLLHLREKRKAWGTGYDQFQDRAGVLCRGDGDGGRPVKPGRSAGRLKGVVRTGAAGGPSPRVWGQPYPPVRVRSPLLCHCVTVGVCALNYVDSLTVQVSALLRPPINHRYSRPLGRPEGQRDL
jgi:hypothetical protein